MLPPLQPSRLALRTLMLGMLIAVLWWKLRGPADASGWDLLNGSVMVSTGSGGLWQELLPRALRSFALVLGTMILATTTGLALALMLTRLGNAVQSTAAWAGRVLAAVPVVGVAWICIAWVVIDQKLPIESLIPYTPPPEQDGYDLQVGRFLWSWLVPMGVLAVPLFGQWLSICVATLCRVWPLPITQGWRAAGLPPSKVIYTQGLRLAWAELSQRWLHVALTGLALTVWIEDLFGLPGWGAFLANGLRQGHSGDVAAALYLGAWLAAALALITGWLQLGHKGILLDSVDRVVHARPQSLPRSILALATLTLVMLAELCLNMSPPVWVTDWLLPWLTSSLPSTWQNPGRMLASAFLTDVHFAGAITLRATFIVATVGTLAALLRQVRILPRVRLLDSLAWSPLLLWATAFDSPTAIAWLLGLAGACGWRDLALALHGADYARAAKVLGVPRRQRWLRHLGQPLLQALVTWSLRMIGTVLLWRVLMDSLHEGPSLGGHIAAAHSTVLLDSSGVLWPTLLAAFGTLLFHVLARVVGNGSDSRLKFPHPRLR